MNSLRFEGGPERKLCISRFIFYGKSVKISFSESSPTAGLRIFCRPNEIPPPTQGLGALPEEHRLANSAMERVERLLAAVLPETQAGAESLSATIMIAVLPIAKVFTMCFLGFLMASKYVNILPASGRKLLNGVSF